MWRPGSIASIDLARTAGSPKASSSSSPNPSGMSATGPRASSQSWSRLRSRAATYPNGSSVTPTSTTAPNASDVLIPPG